MRVLELGSVMFSTPLQKTGKEELDERVVMPDRHVFAALALGILAFGLSISGCQRNRQTALNRPVARERRTARPAEVLAASAYRAPTFAPTVLRNDSFSSAPASNYAVAQVPVAVSRPSPNLPDPFQAQSSQIPSGLVGPISSSPSPAMLQSMPLIQPTPDLVLARADMLPPMQTSYAVALPAAARAPIPELDPDRYRNPGNVSPVSLRLPEITMSPEQASPNRAEIIRRALAPLPIQLPIPASVSGIAAADVSGEWIASPAMAMRGGF
ncbi:MAG: hypothetical protein LBE84_07275 [Planctomycetota bacterium]|jgi:hypothetical protein|nr:hypothetical protein [Planctomycetota bacterium]